MSDADPNSITGADDYDTEDDSFWDCWNDVIDEVVVVRIHGVHVPWGRIPAGKG